MEKWVDPLGIQALGLELGPGDLCPQDKKRTLTVGLLPIQPGRMSRNKRDHDPK